MHLYLPTRLHCLSLLLDQKLQVPSVETFLLCITVKSVICQLKYFISVFLAAFVTITWYVNDNVHLRRAFLSMPVNFNLLIIHSKRRNADVLRYCHDQIFFLCTSLYWIVDNLLRFRIKHCRHKLTRRHWNPSLAKYA